MRDLADRRKSRAEEIYLYCPADRESDDSRGEMGAKLYMVSQIGFVPQSLVCILS